MTEKNQNSGFAICLNNKDCDDLEVRKVYPVIRDDAAEKEGYIRVIDESGESYLYPASYFSGIDLPQAVGDAVNAMALA